MSTFPSDISKIIFSLRYWVLMELSIHVFFFLSQEMVIDKVNGLSIPRYLVYDIVCYNGTSYMENAFWSIDDSIVTRMKCIKDNIIGMNVLLHDNIQFSGCIGFEWKM